MAPKAVLLSGFLVLGAHTAGLVGALIGQGLAMVLIYPLVVRLARRYGAWDPVHDGLFALIGLVFGGLALWLHWPAIAALSALQ